MNTKIIKEIKHGDFPTMHRKLKDTTRSNISFFIDEETFEDSLDGNFDASNYLGSINFSIIEFLTNSDEIVKKNLREKVVKIIYVNDKETEGLNIELNNKTLYVTANYEKFSWEKGKNFKEQLLHILNI